MTNKEGTAEIAETAEKILSPRSLRALRFLLNVVAIIALRAGEQCGQARAIDVGAGHDDRHAPAPKVDAVADERRRRGRAGALRDEVFRFDEPVITNVEVNLAEMAQ